MISKFSSFILAICLLVAIPSSFALDIVTRGQWWANPEYIYKDSSTWQGIIVNSSGYTPSASVKRKYNFLLNSYPGQFSLSGGLDIWSGRPLATPIEYIKRVRRVIVHHTADAQSREFRPEAEVVREIYKYHALNKRWGDIGYNYIIWPSGKIYEWRLWWANARAFHTSYNNEHSIWVALMWNFDIEKPTQQQILSLVQLLGDLVEDYDIPLRDDVPAFRDCYNNCSQEIDVSYDSWLIGHEQAGHTDCPGEHLGNWIKALRGYFVSAQG